MADAPPVASPPPDGMPAGWPRRLAVATITIGLMMSVLSNSMTNLALPYIAQDLNITAESSIWIVNATQIALMVSLLPVAALADIVGYRHVYRFGLVAVLAGLARLRAGAVAALADRGPHLPGPGRCRHHVGPACAGARDLSARPAGPRPRLQHHRGRHLAGRRPLDRRARCCRSPRGRSCSPSMCRSASSPSSWPSVTCRTPRTPTGRST